MLKKVWFLTQFFDPEPTFKGAKFARAISDAGFDVEVITGFPNYPGGKVYKGYRVKLFQKEIIEGIRVNRLALYPSHNRNAIKRALNYLSFFFTAFIFLLLKSKRHEKVYVYHPPITVGLAAALSKKLGGSKYVIDVQDLWPHTLASTGMVDNKLLLKIIGNLSRFVYRNAETVVAQSDGFQAELIKMGVKKCQLKTIFNWCDESLSVVDEKVAELKSNWRNESVMVYCGNLGPAQDLHNILDAISHLQKKVDNFKFVVVGSGIDEESLLEKTSDLGLKNVDFWGRKPRSEIPSILAAANFALVSLKPDPLFDLTLPSKMQEYMFSGTPIIAVGGKELRDKITKSGAGVSILPADPIGLSSELIRLAKLDSSSLQKYSILGRAYYDANFSFKVGVTKFCQLFE